MKIILDTNIYISALAFDAIVEELLLKILDDLETDIYFSPPTFQELEKKLNSDHFSKICAKSKRQISTNQIVYFLEKLKTLSLFHSQIECQVTICRDPRDNMFLELAKTISADFLITGDQDLLALGQFESTKIVKPSGFVKK
jgi:uncharacterized protein